ncbi:hypothetical protein KCU89_g6472, partial [Aureobasidium melanogenum]
MTSTTYSRDATVAAITDFYKFYIRLPYLDSNALVLAPEDGGWPNIDATELRNRAPILTDTTVQPSSGLVMITVGKQLPMAQSHLYAIDERMRMRNDECEKMNHRVATTQQAIDSLIKAAVEKAIIETEIKHLKDTIQTNESLIGTLQERRRDTLNQADAVGNKWKALDAEEVITRKIDKLDSTIISALGIVANMNNTIDISLQFLQKQTAAASARVQELESKLVKEHDKMELDNSDGKVKKETEDVKVKMESTAKGYLEHTKKTLEKVSKKMESIVTGLEKEINDSVQSLINVIKAQIEQRKVDMEKANECKKRQFEKYQLYHKAVESMEEPKSGEIDQRVGAIYCDGHDWLTESIARWEEENKKAEG